MFLLQSLNLFAIVTSNCLIFGFLYFDIIVASEVLNSIAVFRFDTICYCVIYFDTIVASEVFYSIAVFWIDSFVSHIFHILI